MDRLGTLRNHFVYDDWANEKVLGEILEHLHLHGAYHRGQIAAWMRWEGIAPVNTDFITFVRMEGQL